MENKQSGEKRVIKFRGFHKPTGKMIDLKKITPLALTADFPGDGLFIPFSEDVVLMQFTGLLDKNGKEIYEGDIVSWKHKKWVNLMSTTGFSEVNDIGVVVWRDKGFWIDKEDFGWEGENLWNWDEAEIIGNIYEHPNLLTTQSPPMNSAGSESNPKNPKNAKNLIADNKAENKPFETPKKLQEWMLANLTEGADSGIQLGEINGMNKMYEYLQDIFNNHERADIESYKLTIDMQKDEIDRLNKLQEEKPKGMSVKEREYMPLHSCDRKLTNCPQRVPMELLRESQALDNHGQSLSGLADRGGLSAKEMLAVMTGRGFHELTCNDIEAGFILNERVRQWAKEQITESSDDLSALRSENERLKGESRQEAIEFAEWVREKMYYPCDIGWFNEDERLHGEKPFTTSELYTIFQDEQNKSKI